MRGFKLIILIFLLLVLSMVEARVLLRGFPVLTLALLMPLSLAIATEVFVPIAFLAGILKDGLFPQNLWVSPFLFVITGLIGYIFKGYVNLKLTAPKFFYFLLFSLFYILALSWSSGTSISPANLISSVLTTSLLSLFVSWGIQ
ncbi:MAG TPA: hypothetical protein ENG67_01230 [candidate division WOR-3 bacterium]|uniref:Rod shape-determining protein MreD n=1 Tax=candidate division WOR-3 bacterium TaxID=2052148 RepID=A0A7C0X8S1_UNCW3|nr:MAG: hypothetical protein DRQ04_03565 [Candidatus Hydrothermae bacterium]HDM89816.1 hypothetical protein [candidate division WOR-3 bacterium]